MQSIFGGPSASESWAYRAHAYRGRVLALLPAAAAVQAKLTFLLPAYTAKARLYRTGTHFLSALGIGFPRKIVHLPVSGSNSLAALVKHFHRSSHAPVILPGNPNSSAQRIVILPLDESGYPAAVIKAGFSETARRLIQHEADFLTALQNSVSKAGPHLLKSLNEDHCSAFAMAFEKGSPPSGKAEPGSLLRTWIDTSTFVPISAFKAWENLQTALQKVGISLPKSVLAVENEKVHPTLYHGDFAPWNARVHGGLWRVIDWERGELRGVPCWDWLHYHIQPAILVQHLEGDHLRSFITSLVNNHDLLLYGEKARATAQIAPLLRAYLLYNWYVLKPTERMSQHEALAAWALRDDVLV